MDSRIVQILHRLRPPQQLEQINHCLEVWEAPYYPLVYEETGFRCDPCPPYRLAEAQELWRAAALVAIPYLLDVKCRGSRIRIPPEAFPEQRLIEGRFRYESSVGLRILHRMTTPISLLEGVVQWGEMNPELWQVPYDLISGCDPLDVSLCLNLPWEYEARINVIMGLRLKHSGMPTADEKLRKAWLDHVHIRELPVYTPGYVPFRTQEEMWLKEYPPDPTLVEVLRNPPF